MAKKVDGPFVAVAIELPDGASTGCVPSTVGILEIWESERKWPGKRGLCFYYPLTGNPADLETKRYLKSSFSYDLTIADGVASFDKDGRCYRFKLEGSAEESVI